MNIHDISFYSGGNEKTGIRAMMHYYCHFTFQLNDDPWTSHLVHQYKDYILKTVLEKMKTRMLLEEMKYGIVRGVSYGRLQ